PVLRDGDTARHGMAAARLKQARILRCENCRAEIDARNRSTRTLADPVIVERDHDGGAAELFLEPPRDDADHAGMPAARMDDGDRAIALGEAALLRFELNRGLDRAALFVELVQLGGDGA